DYDNDGQLDLFVSAYFSGNNKNTLYRNQGDGTFAKVGTDKLVSEGGNSTASAWGDFNNDGSIDLVVANSLFSGSPSLDLFYQNLGQAGFLKLTNNIVSERRYGRGVSSLSVRMTNWPFSYSYPLTISSHGTSLPSTSATRLLRIGLWSLARRSRNLIFSVEAAAE